MTKKEKKETKGYYIFIGLALGLIYGILLDKLLIGLLVGLVIGASFDYLTKKERKKK